MRTQNIAYSIPFLMFAFSGNLSAQLVNESTLYVSDGTTLSVQTDFTNQSGATVHNEGSLVVKGSLTNHSAYNGTGSVEMADHDSYTTLEMTGDTIHTLILSESDYTELTHDIVVLDSIIFSGGDFLLSGNTLALSDTIGFRNQSSTSHITTNSGRILLLDFDNADGVELPIAYEPNVGYTPLTVANNGASDHFYIEMSDSVTDDGARSGAITASTDRVEAMWMISDSLDNSYSLDLTFQWQADEEGSTFNNADAGVAVYENGAWSLNGNDLSDASGRSITKTGITNIDDIAFAIGDGESDFISSAIQLGITVFLQGPYNTSSDEMNTSLNSVIPTSAADSEVYGSSPFNYAGSESFASVPNADVVDWVLVELRDAASASDASTTSASATVAGLLLKDGSIVSSDGSSNLSIEDVTLTNDLYIVVKHRNHLPIMSASAVTESGGTYSYDFSSSASQSYTNSTDGAILTGSNYSMYRANVSGDRFVNIVDAIQTKIQSSTIRTGVYIDQDVNMDGTINIVDAILAKIQSSTIKSSSVQ